MPKGRAGGIRTGLFIRDYLLGRETRWERSAYKGGGWEAVGPSREEEFPASMHRSLCGKIIEENERRPASQRRRGPVYSSFYRYLKRLEQFGLVERTGREEPIEGTPAGLLRLRNHEHPGIVEGVRVYYRLTASGRTEPPNEAFLNPIAVWYSRGYD